MVSDKTPLEGYCYTLHNMAAIPRIGLINTVLGSLGLVVFLIMLRQVIREKRYQREWNPNSASPTPLAFNHYIRFLQFATLWAGLYAVYKLTTARTDDVQRVITSLAVSIVQSFQMFIEIAVMAFLSMSNVGTQAYFRAAVWAFIFALAYGIAYMWVVTSYDIRAHEDERERPQSYSETDKHALMFALVVFGIQFVVYSVAGVRSYWRAKLYQYRSAHFQGPTRSNALVPSRAALSEALPQLSANRTSSSNDPELAGKQRSGGIPYKPLQGVDTENSLLEVDPKHVTGTLGLASEGKPVAGRSSTAGGASERVVALIDPYHLFLQHSNVGKDAARRPTGQRAALAAAAAAAVAGSSNLHTTKASGSQLIGPSLEGSTSMPSLRSAANAEAQPMASRLSQHEQSAATGVTTPQDRILNSANSSDLDSEFTLALNEVDAPHTPPRPQYAVLHTPVLPGAPSQPTESPALASNPGVPPSPTISSEHGSGQTPSERASLPPTQTKASRAFISTVQTRVDEHLIRSKVTPVKGGKLSSAIHLSSSNRLPPKYPSQQKSKASGSTTALPGTPYHSGSKPHTTGSPSREGSSTAVVKTPLKEKPSPSGPVYVSMLRGDEPDPQAPTVLALVAASNNVQSGIEAPDAQEPAAVTRTGSMPVRVPTASTAQPVPVSNPVKEPTIVASSVSAMLDREERALAMAMSGPGSVLTPATAVGNIPGLANALQEAEDFEIDLNRFEAKSNAPTAQVSSVSSGTGGIPSVLKGNVTPDVYDNMRPARDSETVLGTPPKAGRSITVSGLTNSSPQMKVAPPRYVPALEPESLLEYTHGEDALGLDTASTGAEYYPFDVAGEYAGAQAGHADVAMGLTRFNTTDDTLAPRAAIIEFSAFIAGLHALRTLGMALLYARFDAGLCVIDMAEAMYLALFGFVLFRVVYMDSQYWIDTLLDSLNASGVRPVGGRIKAGEPISHQAESNKRPSERAEVAGLPQIPEDKTSSQLKLVKSNQDELPDEAQSLLSKGMASSAPSAVPETLSKSDSTNSALSLVHQQASTGAAINCTPERTGPIHSPSAPQSAQSPTLLPSKPIPVPSPVPKLVYKPHPDATRLVTEPLALLESRFLLRRADLEVVDTVIPPEGYPQPGAIKVALEICRSHLAPPACPLLFVKRFQLPNVTAVFLNKELTEFTRRLPLLRPNPHVTPVLGMLVDLPSVGLVLPRAVHGSLHDVLERVAADLERKAEEDRVYAERMAGYEIQLKAWEAEAAKLQASHHQRLLDGYEESSEGVTLSLDGNARYGQYIPPHAHQQLGEQSRTVIDLGVDDLVHDPLARAQYGAIVLPGGPSSSIANETVAVNVSPTRSSSASGNAPVSTSQGKLPPPPKKPSPPAAVFKPGWTHVLHVAADIAIGLAHLHSCRGLQPTIKSSNIVFDEHWRASICDFGEGAWFNACMGVSRFSSNLSVAHLAPEVLAGLPSTKASDMYSFGIVLWELLTYAPPFVAVPASDVNLGLSVQSGSPHPTSAPKAIAEAAAATAQAAWAVLEAYATGDRPENVSAYSSLLSQQQRRLEQIEQLELSRAMSSGSVRGKGQNPSSLYSLTNSPLSKLTTPVGPLPVELAGHGGHPVVPDTVAVSPPPPRDGVLLGTSFTPPSVSASSAKALDADGVVASMTFSQIDSVGDLTPPSLLNSKTIALEKLTPVVVSPVADQQTTEESKVMMTTSKQEQQLELVNEPVTPGMRTQKTMQPRTVSNLSAAVAQQARQAQQRLPSQPSFDNPSQMDASSFSPIDTQRSFSRVQEAQSFTPTSVGTLSPAVVAIELVDYATAQELVLKRRLRPPLPPNLPRPLARLLKLLWSPTPSERPTAAQVATFFRDNINMLTGELPESQLPMTLGLNVVKTSVTLNDL